MNATLRYMMQQATRLTRSGRLREATAVIQRAVFGAGHTAPRAPSGRPRTIDHVVVDEPRREAGGAERAAAAGSGHTDAGVGRPQPTPSQAPGSTPSDAGRFTEHAFSHGTLRRAYKLYSPPSAAPLRPLVVMLHGCTQDPDDFAAGTQMNQRAREQDFFVLYPAQSRSANPSLCWNWFKHNHQQRGSGETALIAALTQQVIKEHAIDPRRVYIAGMSAGGAMAVTVATAYPELFTAVGVHSGLAHGAARDAMSALEVMRTGVPNAMAHRHAGANADSATQRPATIVFHGDDDQTVNPLNGENVIAAAVGTDSRLITENGTTAAGRRFTRVVYAAADGTPRAEHWVVHGGGHAWSGGDGAAPYADAKGPDASREMLRFFRVR